MALTADRNTPQRLNRLRNSDPVEASTLIYVGSMVALNASGNAIPAAATAANISRSSRSPRKSPRSAMRRPKPSSSSTTNITS